MIMKTEWTSTELERVCDQLHERKDVTVPVLINMLKSHRQYASWSVGLFFFSRSLLFMVAVMTVLVVMQLFTPVLPDGVSLGSLVFALWGGLFTYFQGSTALKETYQQGYFEQNILPSFITAVSTKHALAQAPVERRRTLLPWLLSELKNGAVVLEKAPSRRISQVVMVIYLSVVATDAAHLYTVGEQSGSGWDMLLAGLWWGTVALSFFVGVIGAEVAHQSEKLRFRLRDMMSFSEKTKTSS